MQEQQGSSWIIVLFVVVFGCFLVAFIVQKVKRRGAQWTGTVIDKSMSEDMVRDSLHDRNDNQGLNIRLGNTNAVKRTYQLRIRDTAGKEFGWQVGEGVYQSVNVGDTLQKQPGTETPTVVSAAPPSGRMQNAAPPSGVNQSMQVNPTNAASGQQLSSESTESFGEKQ